MNKHFRIFGIRISVSTEKKPIFKEKTKYRDSDVWIVRINNEDFIFIKGVYKNPFNEVQRYFVNVGPNKYFVNKYPTISTVGTIFTKKPVSLGPVASFDYMYPGIIPVDWR